MPIVFGKVETWGKLCRVSSCRIPHALPPGERASPPVVPEPQKKTDGFGCWAVYRSLVFFLFFLGGKVQVSIHFYVTGSGRFETRFCTGNVQSFFLLVGVLFMFFFFLWGI